MYGRENGVSKDRELSTHITHIPLGIIGGTGILAGITRDFVIESAAALGFEIAEGVYGRGELAPFSDIDLLFLRPYKQTPHAESVIEFMLYALWDLGFKVGHASRTIEECLKLSREDFTIRTSILEARRLVGDSRAAIRQV